MEALDTANISNCHWKVLVTVNFYHVFVHFLLQQKHLKINLFFGKVLFLR